MAQSSKNEEPGESEEHVDYEDDFEKDLDWFINEDQDNHQDTESQDDDIEAKIDKELQDYENHELLKANQEHDPKSLMDEKLSKDVFSESEAHLNHNSSESYSSSEAALQGTEPDNLPPPDDDFSDQDEEAKRYIAEKIEMANRQLEDEEPVDDKRERKLKFKDNLIDLEVPPLDFVETDRQYSNSEDDSSSRISDLNIYDELKQENPSLLQNDSNDENKDGKVLVEKDGKFELMSLRDIESQSFLPKISGVTSGNEAQMISPISPHGNGLGSPTPKKTQENLMPPNSSTLPPPGEAVTYLPQPPPIPRGRPSSATHAIKGRWKSPRRVQSADMPQRNSTFSLSPQQKERQEKIEKQKIEQRKEMEARKREEEEQKRKENEIAFRAWLQKKKEQLLEEKRILQAKEMEEMNDRNGERDPDEAYQIWLRKKQTEQLREKQMEELKRQEETDSMHGTEECGQAFKQWLKRKRLQKRAEQQAAKELSRRMMLEARRARQIQNLLYTISDTKSLRLKDHFS